MKYNRQKYNRQLMMVILWDRMPYLGEVVNTEIIPLEQAPEAYQTFSEGSPKEVRHRSARQREEGGIEPGRPHGRSTAPPFRAPQSALWGARVDTPKRHARPPLSQARIERS